VFSFFSRSGRRGPLCILCGGGGRRFGLLGGKVLPPRPGNAREYDFLGCSFNFFVPIIVEFGGRRET